MPTMSFFARTVRVVTRAGLPLAGNVSASVAVPFQQCVRALSLKPADMDIEALRRKMVVNHSRDAPPVTATAAPVEDLRSTATEQEDSLEQEKELYQIKRDLTDMYNRGNYEQALDHAVVLHDKVVAIYGKKNAIYASCVNNIALMQKHLGNSEAALDRYIAALHVYEDVSGKLSISYASTLLNLGILYKQLAATTKGLQKQQYLDRAEEALSDTLKLRTQMHGPMHRDTISTSIALASVVRLRGREREAIEQLRQVLQTATDTFGNNDIIVATIENNLGYMLKSQGLFDEARSCYEKALATRSVTLGEKHPDTIVTMSNIAECLLAAGKDAEAHTLQKRILDIQSVSAEEVERLNAFHGYDSEGALQRSQSSEITNGDAPITAAMLPYENNRSRPPTASEILRKEILPQSAESLDRRKTIAQPREKLFSSATRVKSKNSSPTKKS